MARSALSDIVRQPPAPPDDHGFGGDGGHGDWGLSRRASLTGVFVLLAATTMVFAGLAAAYLARRSVAQDWLATPLPPILWANTLALLASSAMLEAARFVLKTGHRAAFNPWWTGGTVCGVLFLLGQGVAWRQLADAGFYLAGNPSGAFFYLVTGVHAVHLLAGIAVLVYVDVRALRFELGPGRRTAADAGAVFWHFLDGVWICLLALFSFLR